MPTFAVLAPAAAKLAPARPGRIGVAWIPAGLEFVLTVAVVALLWPQFERVGRLDHGRDDRFLDGRVVVTGLPDTVLPQLCAGRAAQAEAAVREALCKATGLFSPPVLSAAPAAQLGQAIGAATRAFLAPLRDAEQSDAPTQLACLDRWVEGAIGAGPAPPGTTTGDYDLRRANATLLAAAALDGRAAVASLASQAQLPPAGASGAGCPAAPAMLAAASTLMADARQSSAHSAKNDAMRALLPTAGRQWAVAVAIGYLFLRWSRFAARPGPPVAAALAVWAGAAWLARVPWPLAASRAFEPARPDAGWAGEPAPFVLGLLAAAALLALASVRRRRGEQRVPAPIAAQTMSSRAGYAGFALASGLGWLLLLDLSSNGHAGNRYLALYHQGHLWLAMLALSVLLFLRRPLSEGLAWCLSVAAETARRIASRIGAGSSALALALLAVGGVLLFALALANLRQLTSELGRVWLILGAAWFMFARAGPLTERLTRSRPATASLLRYTWPMLFVIGVLVAAMLLTRDMGPLLIAAYASGAFLGAAVAMWWHHRGGGAPGTLALGGLLFAAWIGAVSAALFRIGPYDSVTASRLESVAAPFASINDQLALVTWFQRAAPAEGFGIGATPWCGLAPAGSCGGVPAQIHSDYTFTALIGVFGPWLAWTLAIGMALWLHRLIRHHGRVTRGEPRLVSTGGRWANDGQALLSWIAVAWVVLASCQLAVTVAGNLGVLPLTGVTLPFVSFGMTSLLVNASFLALCLNVDLPARQSHG